MSHDDFDHWEEKTPTTSTTITAVSPADDGPQPLPTRADYFHQHNELVALGIVLPHMA